VLAEFRHVEQVALKSRFVGLAMAKAKAALDFEIAHTGILQFSV
jgi:hypothetical protein